ncbi:MAG: hypothetical protein H7226_12425 [Salinibacterium sp.]|nr:hypothetical protein [Salinibacterium sp.]
MRWFRRRREVHVGTYVAPEPVEPPPVDRIAEDGVLIAESVVRMTLRNRIIVDALRDGKDLDRSSLVAIASAELESLADNEWETAERMKLRRESFRVDAPWADDTELVSARQREGQRRESVHRALSKAFADRAAESELLSVLVEQARVEAWDEVAPVLVDRAMIQKPVRTKEYESLRDERLGALLALDLSELAAERGVTLY